MSRLAPDPSSRPPRSATASPSARTVSLFVPSRLARQRRALGRQSCCPSRPILTAPRSHFLLSQGKFAMIKDCVVIADGTIVPDYAVLAPFSHVAGAPGSSPPCRASLLVDKAHERLTSLLSSQAGGLATYPNRPKKRRSPARRTTMLASEPRPPRTGRRQTARQRRHRPRARWRCRGNRRALAPKDGRSDAEKEGEGVGARDSGVWRELERAPTLKTLL
jgi:hypothetical protein